MNTKFNFIYCLAGKGKRFTAQQITLPKYLLQLEDGQTILEKSILEFNFSAAVDLHLVINEEHQGFVGQIEAILSKFENNFSIVVTPDTQGQAETGFIGCTHIHNQDPIFFFNGDTILRGRDVATMSTEMTSGFAGAIDIFLESRNHFSFVLMNDEGLVEKIAEKDPISNYATTGLYGFGNKEVYAKYYHDIRTTNEMYISDIYKLMLENNEKIKGYVYKNEMDTIILGTPEEYFSNKHKI
ncbi:sugar phosphate nucleotidyltransferase [Flagellimonas sp.]|uniref:sugar phosphate nucleotidyltransferase n=1 Tax=Flagellimonas sp. TaxID=2058762 RepID=UPI003B592C5A